MGLRLSGVPLIRDINAFHEAERRIQQAAVRI